MSFDNFGFQIVKLLSQYLPRLDRYGEVFEHTSCVNFEEAEVIGLLYGISELIKENNPNMAKYLTSKIIPFYEIYGIARWQRDIVTHLGARVGRKHVKRMSLGSKETRTATQTEDQLIEGVSQTEILSEEYDGGNNQTKPSS